MKPLNEFLNEVQTKAEQVDRLGKLDLATGRAEVFNVFKVWGEDSIYMLIKDSSRDDTYYVVAGYGTKPYHNVGDDVTFRSKARNSFLFHGKVVDNAQGTDIKKWAKKYTPVVKAYSYY